MIGIWLLIPLVLLIHFVLLFNTRFTLWPEMVVYPYLLNSGFELYKDIINPYSPILISFLAIYARVFGYEPLAYQIFTWIMILAIDICIFKITQAIFRKQILAIISALFFVIFSIPFSVNGLWFDLIQTPLILLAIYHFYVLLVQKKFLAKKLFFAFFFLTVAFFIKQQVIWLIFLFAVLFVRRFGKNSYDILSKNYIVFLPFLFLLISEVIIFWQKNLLSEFLFWNFYFPFIKASQMPGYIDFPTLRQLLIVFLLFLVFIPTILGHNEAKARLLILMGLPTLLFAYPRFDYFHLVPALAVLAISFGQNLNNFWKSTREIKIICVASLILLSTFTTRYLLRNWTAEVRFFEKDVFRAAIFLQKITAEDELVYIQNGPDQILPLAQRLPPKPWADEFPWYLEIPSVQERIIDGIKRANPKFVIFKPYDEGPKYKLGSYRPSVIADYLYQNYQNLMQISDTLWLKVRK